MAVSVTYRDFRMSSVTIGSNSSSNHQPKRSSLDDEQQQQKPKPLRPKKTAKTHKHHHHHHHQHRGHRKKTPTTSRTLAIEQAYVHDVYSLIAAQDHQHQPQIISSPVRSYVETFLQDFDPGSIMLDIGCGDGQYLDLRPDVVLVGLERCSQWFHHVNYQHLKQDTTNCLLVGNVLCLPFRDEFFDGILCCGVLHHLSTLERRIKALKEMARIMKIGAKILLTVTSSGFNHVRSQDVLIRVDHPKGTNPGCPNFATHSRTTSDEHHDDVRSMVGENYSSPSNSELENCYSFFKKAIKRFSLASSQLYPFRNSFEEPPHQWLSGKKWLNTDYYPIELRNLDDPDNDDDDDDDRPSCPSSKSSSTDVDSALSSFNRSGSGCSSQTSSNQAGIQFPSSILTVIKDHLISWKSHLANSFEQQWQSFDSKSETNRDNVGGCRKDSYDCPTQSSNDDYHRFSLPIGFWRSDPNHHNNSFHSTAPKSKLSKNKIYASNCFEKRTMLQPETNGPSDHKDIRWNEPFKQPQPDLIDQLSIKSNITTDQASLNVESWDSSKPEPNSNEHDKCSMDSDSRKNTLPRKSFSGSESSNHGVHYSRYKLLAFYSMPELSTLFGTHSGQDGARRRSDSDCKPKAGQRLNSRQNSANERAEEILKTMDDIFCVDQRQPPSASMVKDDPASTIMSAPPLPTTTETTTETTITTSTITTTTTTTTTTTMQKPKAIDVSKFTKKLLRQRSFSADYQPETVKIPPDPPRRFSASPNIETHRYNKSDHIPHNQQISMDSEESFVTIIPAHNISQADYTNNNFSDNNLTDFDIEDEDDCTNNQLFSPNTDMYSCSSEEEEACCESLENDVANTSNDTSISSVLEATIKSISRSDSMDSHDEITTISSMEEISHEEENDSDPGSEDGGESGNPPDPVIHQYYHLFCSGELEQIIEDHVQNLHVIDSFYSECAMSWCVIAEKIHVWTI